MAIKSQSLDNAIFQELNVTPVIHAAGTKTTHGGAKCHPLVWSNMKKASESFVAVEELNRKVGAYIAKVTGAEAGMVTSGAASGMVLSAAGCVTKATGMPIFSLPLSQNTPNEVILQRIHRGSYSDIYTHAGVKLVEVGNVNFTTFLDVESQINEKTVALAYLLGPRISTSGLSLKDFVRIGQKYKIPVLVDAAAMLPPKENLRRFVDEGADLVTISGGKIIAGPQASGLLFGKKSLIEAAFLNASPGYAIGRAHKISKEQIVGLYTALKLYLELDEEKYLESLRKKLKPVQAILKGIPNISTKIVCDGINYNVPILAIQFNEGWRGPAAEKIPSLLLEEEPRVFMQFFKELQHLVVNPISLQKGEPEIVGHKLAELFKKFS